MKLDMDLVEEILIRVEDRTDGVTPVDGRSLELDRDWDEVYYHLKRLGPKEANWIDVRFHLGGSNVRIVSLTRDGHDALAKLRNETVRAELKQQLGKMGDAVSMGTVQLVLSNIARAFGLDAG